MPPILFDEAAECQCGSRGCHIIAGEPVCPTCEAEDATQPEEEAGHWRCVWWSLVNVYFRDAEGSASVADRLGPDEFVTPFRFATEAAADGFGRREASKLQEEGWTPDRLRYERAEFFPDYPAA